MPWDYFKKVDTYSNYHDAVIQESKSNKGDGVMQQDCEANRKLSSDKT